MRRYANEGREGAGCRAHVRDERAARDWREHEGEEIPRGCLSCENFNGVKCRIGEDEA